MLHYFSIRALPLAVLVLVGCQSSPADGSADVIPPLAARVPTAALPPVDRCALPVYDLAALSTTLSATSRLEEEVVAALVQRNPQLPDYFGTYSPYEDLYALDTLSCGQYRLVSWFYRHEDCCADLYYLTLTPDGQHVLDWQRVASRGADGFWQAESKMQGTANESLTVTTVAENREDEGPTYYRDSIVRAFTLTPQGRFTRTRVDSIRTNHTDQNP